MASDILSEAVSRFAQGLFYRQDIPHSPGGFLLGAGGDVGVGVQGEAGGEAAQHAGRCSAEGFMEKALFPSLQTSFGIFHASWSVCKSA